MSVVTTPCVNVEIMGKRYAVPPGITLVQAMWHVGLEVVRGVGCLGGVCGACATYYRLPGQPTMKSGLACQLRVEEGISFSFAPSFPIHKPTYNIEEIVEPKQDLFRYFPEAALCRNCNACTEACPQDIDVRTGIWKAAFGDFQAAADLFLPCVMCGLCVPVCIAGISSNQVGLYARRTQGALLNTLPPGLDTHIDEIQSGKYAAEWERLAGLSEAEMAVCPAG